MVNVKGYLRCMLMLGMMGCSAQIGSEAAEGAADEPVDVAAEALQQGTHAFAWADRQSSTTPYTPNTSFSFLSAGIGPMGINRGSTGTYGVLIEQAPLHCRDSGNVQVVAYGAGPTRCKVVDWAPFQNDGSKLGITVQCHNGTLPTDSKFVFDFTCNDGSVPSDSGYVRTNASGGIMAGYSFNSRGNTNSILRLGTGYYRVTFPGLGLTGGTVQVTAAGTVFGADPSYCKVSGWGPSGTSQTVNVLCFDANGNAFDTGFSLNYDSKLTTPNDMGARAWADNSTASSYSPNATYSFNSGTVTGHPGVNTAGRFTDSSGELVYFMRHSKLPPTGSSPHVTAYGTDAAWCKINSWFASGDGTEVQSRCFAPLSIGHTVSSRYVETYQVKGSVAPF